MMLAAACAEAGLDVLAFDPSLDAPWSNNYGVWLDEAERAGLRGYLDPIWMRTEVRLDAERRHLLDRGYARVEGVALKAALRARAEAHGARFFAERVVDVRHRQANSELRTESGDNHGVRLVVEASGHKPRWVRREGDAPTAFQTAFGLECEVRGLDDAPRDLMTLMDFSDAGPGAPDVGVPTFLYVMPLGDDRWFFEETVLTGAPAVPISALEQRLYARLRNRGVTLGARHEVERCVIPMNAPAPLLRQRVVGFGGAASMVHPATGYMFAHAARLAPELAARLAELMASPERSPQAIAAGAWDVVWPAWGRRAEEFYRFGGDSLLRLGPREIRDFFDAFFSLPDFAWRGYLGRDLGPATLGRAMFHFYRALSPARRLGLGREVLRQPGRLLKTLVGPSTRRPPRPSPTGSSS